MDSDNAAASPWSAFSRSLSGADVRLTARSVASRELVAAPRMEGAAARFHGVQRTTLASVSLEAAGTLVGRWTDGGVPEGAPCAGGRPSRGSPGSLLVRPGCDPHAGDTMRLHLRSTVLAAALIAP